MLQRYFSSDWTDHIRAREESHFPLCLPLAIVRLCRCVKLHRYKLLNPEGCANQPYSYSGNDRRQNIPPTIIGGHFFLNFVFFLIFEKHFFQNFWNFIFQCSFLTFGKIQFSISISSCIGVSITSSSCSTITPVRCLFWINIVLIVIQTYKK